MSDDVLRIGEFARVAQVSVAALRHYEKVGLLKPAALDAETGYRYYALDQLPRMNRLLALKDLGFSLEQIACLLEEELPVEQLRGMFLLKQAQTQQLLEREQARLVRIAARLRQIEQEGNMPAYDVVVKEADPMLVASLRALVPLEGGFERSYKEVATYLERYEVQSPASPLVLLYSAYQQREEGLYIDAETALPLAVSLPGNEHITVHTLPSALLATTTHVGPDLFLGQAYTALHRWLKDNAYQLTAPPRLHRLRYGPPINPAQHITEVQFPITGHTIAIRSIL